MALSFQHSKRQGVCCNIHLCVIYVRMCVHVCASVYSCVYVCCVNVRYDRRLKCDVKYK